MNTLIVEALIVGMASGAAVMFAVQRNRYTRRLACANVIDGIKHHEEMKRESERRMLLYGELAGAHRQTTIVARRLAAARKRIKELRIIRDTVNGRGGSKREVWVSMLPEQTLHVRWLETSGDERTGAICDYHDQHITAPPPATRAAWKARRRES